MHKTARDVTVTWCGSTFIVPAGTVCVAIKDGMDIEHYAIRDAKVVTDLTGNKHDAKYRYVFVPKEAFQ